MKNDKKQMEQLIEKLYVIFSVTNNCMSIKDERGPSDLLFDTTYIELKNVCIVQ